MYIVTFWESWTSCTTMSAFIIRSRRNLKRCLRLSDPSRPTTGMSLQKSSMSSSAMNLEAIVLTDVVDLLKKKEESDLLVWYARIYSEKPESDLGAVSID